MAVAEEGRAGDSAGADPHESVAQLALTRAQESVPLARRFVTDVARRWRLHDVVDAAELISSELATNALLHGAPPVSLVVRRRVDGVRIELHDGRRADPTLGRQRLLSTRGRGMAMVEMLSADWGVDTAERGKVVWAEVRGDLPAPEDSVTVHALEALWGADDMPDTDGSPDDRAAAPPQGDSPVDTVAMLATEIARGADPATVHELQARVMVDHMYQFVGLLTADGVLIDANVPALVAGGLEPSDVLGRHFWECAWWQVSPRTVRDVRDAVRSAREGREARYDVDVWAGAAGSQLVTIDFSCRPIRDADGVIEFIVVEGRDITEKKRAEIELAEAVEQLATANRRLTELDALRREFIANVSHELRTPLTVILSGADRLLRDQDRPPAVDAQRIRDAGAVLLKRVNDLLSAAALEQQRELRRGDVDLGVLARGVAAQYEGLAADRRQRLVTAVETGCVASVDADLVESLVSNLVANAVKFTPVGGVVRLTVQRWGERALLEVADSGPGIPGPMRTSVLEPFRQVEGSETRAHEGTGLGLAIAAQVAARHGGTIAVSDAPEGGALVTVTLPLAEDATDVTRGDGRLDRVESPVSAALQADVDALRAELKPPSDVATGSSGERARLLVAEDNVDLGDYLVELLGDRYDVTLARSGTQALELAFRDAPDLIVSDVMMPGLSGMELLRRTRSDPALARTAVVLLTAKADTAQRVEALRAGAADYVLKPFDPSELVARVNNALRTRAR
ncbi:MAG: response regulator [Actinomycetota bacterium]|nr:response regulator [Actinomycetota bacterium]